jgi:hypothetical protein
MGEANCEGNGSRKAKETAEETARETAREIETAKYKRQKNGSEDPPLQEERGDDLD